MNENSRAKITYVSLTDECYARLKDDILNNVLQWGEQLDVTRIAKDFGVSRSPVVKAIERLNREGLVEIRPNKGSFVRTPTQKDILEICELRMAIEAMTIELAYQKHRDELLAKLAEHDRAISGYEEKGEEVPEDVFLKYDRDFHWIFTTYADNRHILETIDVIRNQVELFRIRTYSLVKAKQSIERHRAVVRCLKEDRLADAIQILRQHIAEVCEFAMETIGTAIPDGDQ